MKKWNKIPKWIPDDTILGSFFIITKKDDNALCKSNCLSFAQLSRDYFWFPDIKSMRDDTMEQKITPLSPKERNRVVKACSNGCPVDKFPHLVKTITNLKPISLHSINKIVCGMVSGSAMNEFCQIFAGSGC